MIHWFDIFVIVFLLISTVWSYFRGMAKEVLSIATIVAGYWVASSFYLKAAPAAQWLSPDKSIKEMAAFAFLFLVTVVLMVIVGVFIRRVLNVHKTLSSLNRITGAGVGLIKGVLILSVIALPLAMIPGLQDELIKKSRAAPVLVGISGSFLEKFAPGLAESVKESGYLKKKETNIIETMRDTVDRLKKIDVTKEVLKLKETVGEYTEKATEKAVDVKNKIVGNGNEGKGNADSDEGITETGTKEMDELIDSSDKGR